MNKHELYNNYANSIIILTRFLILSKDGHFLFFSISYQTCRMCNLYSSHNNMYCDTNIMSDEIKLINLKN